MKGGPVQGRLVMWAVVVLALALCGTKLPLGPLEQLFGDMNPPPQSAEAPKRERASGRQLAEEAKPPRTVEEVKRLLEALERQEEERLEEARKREVVTLEGLTEIFRIGNVGAVTCGDLVGDGAFRILADKWSRKGQDVQWERFICDLDGRVIRKWPLERNVSQLLLVQADDDAEKEILTSYHGTRRGRPAVTLYDADGGLLWNDTICREPYVEGTPDLDGDGKSEILIRDLRRSIRLLASDGSICWERSDLPMIGRLQAGDLDGDGSQELVGKDPVALATGKVFILDSDGKTRRTFSREDIEGLEAVLEVVDIAAESPGAEIVALARAPGGRAGSRQILVLDARGTVLRSHLVEDFGQFAGVAEVVPTSPGPEMVVTTYSRSTETMGAAVFSANGVKLFDVPVVGNNAFPREGIQFATAGGLFAAARTMSEPEFVVCDGQGRTVAKASASGSGLQFVLVGATDAPGRPIFLLKVLHITTQQGDDLVGYALEEK